MAKKRLRTKSSGGSEIAAKKPGIVRHPIADEKALYSNHIVVRCDPAVFHLFFYDAQAPVVAKGDVTANDGKVDHAEARCVARIAIPHFVMPGLIDALTTNYRNLEGIMAQFSEMMQGANEKGNG
jgi:hypothetical protein